MQSFFSKYNGSTFSLPLTNKKKITKNKKKKEYKPELESNYSKKSR